jgi:hypothetical protein
VNRATSSLEQPAELSQARPDGSNSSVAFRKKLSLERIRAGVPLSDESRSSKPRADSTSAAAKWPLALESSPAANRRVEKGITIFLTRRNPDAN